MLTGWAVITCCPLPTVSRNLPVKGQTGPAGALVVLAPVALLRVAVLAARADHRGISEVVNGEE